MEGDEERLDECLARFMEQFELLEEKRRSFNSLIEQGWFSICKARYAMGNKQVSSLQYASEADARVRVHARGLQRGEAQFQLQRVGHAHVPVKDIGPADNGLRRRLPKKSNQSQDGIVTEDISYSDDQSSQQDSPSSTQHLQDPLRWFGVLVPQSLRQAQSSFRQVIELSADIAAMQSALLSTREEMRTLWRVVYD